MVRAFFIENALHWLHEYHVDGLRLDATHALVDDSPRHFLAELRDRVRAGRLAARRAACSLIAEDHRNLARHRCGRDGDGGCGLDAVWADDFHHQMRRALAGDHEGYFARLQRHDAPTWRRRIRQRLVLQRPALRALRAGRAAPIPPASRRRSFVVCLQNHDQIGNRAFGERLHHQIDRRRLPRRQRRCCCARPRRRCCSWARSGRRSTPFLFFTDHTPELGAPGHRRPARASSRPSPPSPTRASARASPIRRRPRTFRAAVSTGARRAASRTPRVLRLYRALLALRRASPLLRAADWRGFAALPIEDWGVLLLRRRRGAALLVVAALRCGGRIDLTRCRAVPRAGGGRRWRTVLHTEGARFATDPRPLRVARRDGRPVVELARPGAVVLRLG